MAAYLLLQNDLEDAEGYKAYAARTPAVVQRYGGRFVVRGGSPEALEGDLLSGRVVLIEFADRAAVRRFYESPEYQTILPLRLASSNGRVAIVDGA